MCRYALAELEAQQPRQLPMDCVSDADSVGAALVGGLARPSLRRSASEQARLEKRCHYRELVPGWLLAGNWNPAVEHSAHAGAPVDWGQPAAGIETHAAAGVWGADAGRLAAADATARVILGDMAHAAEAAAGRSADRRQLVADVQVTLAELG